MNKEYLERFKEARDKVGSRLHKSLHKGETVLHIGYCYFVFMEGHGMYPLLGGAMGLFVVVQALLGEGED